MPNIITITDFADPALDIFARKTENQLLNREHPEDGIFIAESPKVVERALDGGYVPVSVLVEDRHIDGEARSVLDRVGDVPVYTASFELLKQLTGFPLTRGVLCAMGRKALPSLEETLAGATRVAVLENVMNPLYRRAIRVSMGTVFQVPWTFAPENWQAELKRLGFATAALALREDTLSIRDERLAAEKKLALVLGTEGDGLADGTITACDYTVKIPMTHGVDSLNVAAASAVAFFQLGNN